MRLTYKLWFGLFPLTLVIAGLGSALVATSDIESNPALIAVVYPVIGLSFAVTGLLAWTLRPANGTGRLLVLVGMLWMLSALWESGNGWIYGLATMFGSLFLAAFVQLMLSFPEGRLSSLFERRLIVGLWVTAFLANALPNVFSKRAQDCDNCPDNPYVIVDDKAVSNGLEVFFTVVGLVIFLGVLVLLIRRWRGASRARRRILGPVYLSGGVATALVGTLFVVSSFSSTAGNFLAAAAFVAFGTVPLFFLAGLLRDRLSRPAARLLREVPEEPTPEEAQEGLRTVLGDPSLQFLTWLDETGCYVDVRGNPARLQPDTARRVTTRIDREADGHPLAALVHDSALLHQRGVLDEVVAAARLAIEKDRGLQALRRSEARSRALLDALPDLVFRMARDGTYLEVKGDPASMILPPEELIGASIRDVLPREVSRRFESALSAPVSKGVQTTEYRLEINGELRDFEARMVPAGNDEVVVIVRDFTDRTRLEEELSRKLEMVEREQEFVRDVVDVAPVIFLLIDTEGGIIRFNDSTEQLFGIRDDERVRGRPWWDVFLPEENRPMAQAYCKRMNEGEIQLAGEIEWQAVDGRRLYIAATVRRVIDGEGNIRYLICGQDLTELIRQREELKEQRDFLDVVARATPSLLVAVERDGTVAPEAVNFAFRELMGYSDDEVIGRKFWDLVAPPEMIAEVREAFEEQVETGVSIEHETAWIGKSGTWKIIAWWLRPLAEIDKYIVCGTDVTERKAQEAELRASRSRIVEAADDARMRLERNLHDGAQQRLVSLSLALRLAQARLRDDPEAANQLLANAWEELNQALAELRELARGIHPAVLTDRGLPAALEALAARAPLPVELSADLEERLPGPVEAAAYYVVAEALTNVAKYSEASAVEVRAQRHNGRVVVEVADDGVGGADPALGSGLRGLADRVEALDGQFEVTSTAGSGTTVRAVIPLLGD